jgi:hypothetical protein
MCSSKQGVGRRGLRRRCGPSLLRRYQPRALQRLFHPAVAQLDAFGFLELLVEMAHVEVRILVAVQGGLDRTTKVLIRPDNYRVPDPWA